MRTQNLQKTVDMLNSKLQEAHNEGSGFMTQRKLLEGEMNELKSKLNEVDTERENAKFAYSQRFKP